MYLEVETEFNTIKLSENAPQTNKKILTNSDKKKPLGFLSKFEYCYLF